MVYGWKWPMPVAAQAAGEHLEKLEWRHGRITPSIVLDDSRAEDALLHPCFEWNDVAAAELYRENQARFLIRNLTVRVELEAKPPQPVRAFVNVESEDSRAYITIGRALSEAKTREQVLRDAVRSLQSFRDKYQSFVEFASIISAIDALEPKTQIANKTAEGREAPPHMILGISRTTAGEKHPAPEVQAPERGRCSTRSH